MKALSTTFRRRGWAAEYSLPVRAPRVHIGGARFIRARDLRRDPSISTRFGDS